MYKFKTMKLSDGPCITSLNDCRVTKLGRYLRNTKLDEIPQFFNVLKGDMSFVGYRPELPELLAEEHLKSEQYLNMKPGMTGLSSIEYIDENKLIPDSTKSVMDFYIKEIAPKKRALDLKYYRDVSFYLDLKLAIKTFWLLLKNIILKH